jgi:hypothetical protein
MPFLKRSVVEQSRLAAVADSDPTLERVGLIGIVKDLAAEGACR